MDLYELHTEPTNSITGVASTLDSINQKQEVIDEGESVGKANLRGVEQRKQE